MKTVDVDQPLNRVVVGHRCVCGHLKSDHSYGEEGRGGACTHSDCKCAQYSMKAFVTVATREDQLTDFGVRLLNRMDRFQPVGEMYELREELRGMLQSFGALEDTSQWQKRL